MVQAFTRRARATPLRRVVDKRERDGRASYGNRRWRRQSAQWLKRYPFCIACLCEGSLNGCVERTANDEYRSLVVDHIVPHKNDLSLFWDQENWQTLGKYHHDSLKSHVERTNKDWWSTLRTIIRDKQAREFIDQHREWIPEHVWTALT